MNNEILIIILLCVYKIECQQIETKIDEESQDEEAEERLEAEDLQKAEEDQEAEEYENRADDKVEEPEQLIEEKESNESDEEQVQDYKELIKEKEMKHKLEDNAPLEENEENFPKEEMEIEQQKEKEAGDPADLFGTNQHYNIPANFDDFGRRFIWAYPYNVKNQHGTVDAAELKLDRDVEAPPAFVLSIAKQSALLEGTKPKNPSEDIITRNILRTGDFWDSVWKEDVDVDRILRTSNKKSDELERVTVKIDPGSKLYELISKLKKISPTLIYVINKNNNN
ncbi:unnamed protein product, partial [Brenthis ino]